MKPTDNSRQVILLREEREFIFLSSDLNKAFYLFLGSVLPAFEKTNALLQANMLHTHLLRSLLLDVLKIVLSKVVKSTAIKSSGSLLELDYHTIWNQKDDCNLVIGSSTINVVDSLKQEKSIFFFGEELCYCSMVHKFPFKHDVLIHADISSISKASFFSIRFFVNEFPGIFNGNVNVEMDILQSQFCTFQF
jgi:hypothetical protein